jgi:type 1 glutamine amidotransferase
MAFVIMGGIGLNAGSASEPIRVLIVDGHNNHNWKATTPVMKQVLEETGRFKVDVATAPGDKEALASFRPKFSDYQVILSNYNGPGWPEPTRKDFEQYMRDGGGFVVIHAADNPFPEWKSYNEMIGLGGWGGRDEKSGPYVRWRDGKIVRDETPGRGGSHGTRHAYVIDVRAPEHPIMKGLPTRWKHAPDELYDRMRGPAKNMTVLATAYSSPDEKGTGEHEPVLLAITWGKGRIYHDVTGHDADVMKDVAFQTTLIRGTEWAATGKVTMTRVPKDFPTPEKVSLREPKPEESAKPAKAPE